jgi:hypothetical protein
MALEAVLRGDDGAVDRLREVLRVVTPAVVRDAGCIAEAATPVLAAIRGQNIRGLSLAEEGAIDELERAADRVIYAGVRASAAKSIKKVEL